MNFLTYLVVIRAQIRTIPIWLSKMLKKLWVDTNTGEIIEPDEVPDPYADTELMYKLYMLLDQKVEIVK